MSFQVFRSGTVGPSNRIGGSSEYHIDSKFSTALGADKAREMFEAKVREYNKLGRNVEFSNQGVAGSIYDMNLPTDQRAALFNQAAAAHANRPGYYSLDYYAPKYGETRFGASAETAPIFGVAPVGGKAVPGIGGNYGYHNLIYDAKGNLVSKVGHGDSAAPGSMDVRYFGGSDDVIAAATGNAPNNVVSAATASPQQPTLSTLPQVSPQISQVDIAGKFAPILNETLSTPSRGMSGQLGDLFTQDYDTQYGLNAPEPYDIRDDQSVMEFVMA
jgi:hypothetical protein